MSKCVIPNSSIDLKINGTDQINFDTSVFKFLATQKQAPIPKYTVGKAQSLRERILVVSLFPDIYTRTQK